tara:strand:- start:504 stop:1364 length:861 start_codon:yes stop_codon:yes gene_type:complete
MTLTRTIFGKAITCAILLTASTSVFADSAEEPINFSQLEDKIRNNLGDNNKRFSSDEEIIIAKSIILADGNKENRVGVLDEYMLNHGVSTKGTSYFNEYDQNEIKADSKFKRKNVYIRGLIKGINKDITGTPFLSLNGGGYLQDTVARFDDNKENIQYLSNLNKGEIVDLKCVGAGLALMSPTLNNCMPLAKYRTDLANRYLKSIDEDRDYAWVLTQLAKIANNQDYSDNELNAIYLFIAKMVSLSGRSCNKVGIECFKKADIRNIPESVKKEFNDKMRNMKILSS